MAVLDKTGRFSMRRVVRDTGMSADTLRAWEDRYGLPEPARSRAGHRLYSLHDIEVIKWMLKRKAEGIRPGQAARLFKDLTAGGEDPLAGEVLPARGAIDQGRIEDLRRRWLDACLQFDEAGAHMVLGQAFAQFQPVDVLLGVLVEGMNEIGRGWLEGRISVAQEHCATQIATRKLEQLIAALPQATRPESILVACPPGERHALPALLMAYLVGQAGWRVIYLGADLPEREVDAVVRGSQTEFAILAGSSLATSPAMAGMITRLQELGIPSGYGGFVYSRNPALREFMPGNYLGEDLDQIVEQMPAWLAESSSPAALAGNSFDAFLTAFRAQKSQIARALQMAFAAENQKEAELEDLCRTFLDSIEAAAQFGNLGLLAPELAWMAAYLRANRQLHVSVQEFLTALGEASQATLGEASQVLLTWLAENDSR